MFLLCSKLLLQVTVEVTVDPLRVNFLSCFRHKLRRSMCGHNISCSMFQLHLPFRCPGLVQFALHFVALIALASSLFFFVILAWGSGPFVLPFVDPSLLQPLAQPPLPPQRPPSHVTPPVGATKFVDLATARLRLLTSASSITLFLQRMTRRQMPVCSSTVQRARLHVAISTPVCSRSLPALVVLSASRGL